MVRKGSSVRVRLRASILILHENRVVIPKPLLVVQHVSWEGPHRILHAFDGVVVQIVDVLESDCPLPAPAAVRGAVFMGGPMSVNDTGEHPRLAEEVTWLQNAVAAGLPVLGVCLGSQLLARALGADVRRGQPEIGVSPVEFSDPADPVVGPLAPTAPVLHWHGEIFEVPEGAQPLARSAATDVQAFRARNAWGLLFHAEADGNLVELWLDEPVMANEARRTLGPDYAIQLRRGGPGRCHPIMDWRYLPGSRAVVWDDLRSPRFHCMGVNRWSYWHGVSSEIGFLGMRCPSLDGTQATRRRGTRR